MVVDRIAPSPRTIAVYRPVQYLGSKLRSLEAITSLVSAIAPGATVADPFCGTSVVSQALGAQGHQVRSSDALVSAATFARALLGVAREPTSFAEVLDAMLPAGNFRWAEAWAPWVEREREAIAARDGEQLIALSLQVPQIWRRGASGPLHDWFDRLARRTGESAIGVGPLAASHYAGTYFGVGQALEIDAILQSIALLRSSGQIGPWAQAVLHTALLSVASDAAFSAGKHYAQPHAIHRSKDLAFARGRILQDRARDIRSLFVAQVHRVVASAADASAGHRVIRGTIEELSPRDWFRGVRVIYADPPYTAQQYSRFYHVPEVLLDYTVPCLDRVGSKLTRGLYPVGRYKSPYSSKRQAPGAFRSLCRTAQDVGASLVISYSATATGATGNDRMIGLHDLRSICEDYFPGRVETFALRHAYRQFNGTDLAVARREDPEFLIACHAHPR